MLSRQGTFTRPSPFAQLSRAGQPEYVLVPREPLDDLVWAQAMAKAKAEIGAVEHTMELEDQRPDLASRAARIDEAARHHVDKRGLWT